MRSAAVRIVGQSAAGYFLVVEPTISRSIDVAADPDAVWAMVSDLPRMGEFSPENVGGQWVDGATGPAVGARFRGTNRNGAKQWWTRVRVVACEPGRRFTFDVRTPFGFRAPVAVWRKFLSPNPPPLFHDFFAMLMRVPDFVLEGDSLIAMQNARALHRMMNIMRETGAPNV